MQQLLLNQLNCWATDGPAVTSVALAVASFGKAVGVVGINEAVAVNAATDAAGASCCQLMFWFKFDGLQVKFAEVATFVTPKRICSGWPERSRTFGESIGVTSGTFRSMLNDRVRVLVRWIFQPTLDTRDGLATTC